MSAKGEFYPMYFRTWDEATACLSLEQEAAYLRLCHAMYNIGGPIRNEARILMGLFRCGNVKAAALVRQLIAAGKITLNADGKLSNERVMAELAERAERSAARSRKPRSEGSDPRVTPECTPSDPRVTPCKPLKTNEALDTEQDRTEQEKTEATLRAASGARAQVREGSPPDDAVEARAPTLARIPADWAPDDEGVVAAMAAGMPLEAVELEAAAFRDRHLSRRTISADWSAEWRGWCRAFKRLVRGRGQVQIGGGGGGLRVVEGGRAPKGRDAWAHILAVNLAEHEAAAQQGAIR